MISLHLNDSLEKNVPKLLSKEPKTGFSMVPELLSAQNMDHSFVAGLKRRTVIPSKGLPSTLALMFSTFPRPVSTFRISWVASNSTHSFELLNLDFNFLLWIFHLPSKKSKSLAEEVKDDLISNSPAGESVRIAIFFLFYFVSPEI